MAITCVLTPEQLESLYSVVYADLKLKLRVKNKDPQYNFDFEGYMKELYNDLIQGSDEDTVLNFMQMVPQMVGNIAMLPSFLRAAQFDHTAIAKYIVKYTDPENGYDSMRNDLGLNISAEDLRKSIKETEALKNSPTPVVEFSPERITELEFRYKAENGATTTTQEFVEKDPSQVDQERQDQDKKRLYSVVNRIADLNPGKLTSVNYPKSDGTSIKLMLKTIKLSSLSSDQRYDYSNKFIARANAIKDQGGKRDKEVLSPDEIVSLVVTDANGDYVYFDTEGNITDVNNGKIVYSLMRSARKQGNRYVVRDVYNREDMILSAEDQVAGMMKRDKSITQEQARELYKEIEAGQQKQFKELYDIRQQVIKGKNFILPITDVSKGVFNKKVVDDTRGPLEKVLSELPQDARQGAIESISVHTSDFDMFKEGETSILLGDKRFGLDRPLITSKLATKIARALTDPNIPNAKKIDFYNQFFDKAAKLPNTNIDIVEKDGKLYLKYYPLSKAEYHFNNQKRLKLMGLYTGDLNGYYGDANKAYQAALKEASKTETFPSEKIAELDLSSPLAFSMVQDILMNGTTKIVNEEVVRFPARIIFNGYNLGQSGIFNDYDTNRPGEFVESNYMDFLLSDQVNIEVILPKDANLPMYNKYMHYSLPSELNTKIEQATKDVNETEFVVNVFKGDDIVQHTYFTKGGKYYSTLPAEEFEGAMLPVTQEITQEEFDSAYAKALTNNTLASTTEPKKIDTDTITEDAQEVKGSKTSEQKAEDRKSSIIEKLADPNKNHPLDTKGISKKFKFKRKSSLPQGVTKSQIEAAEKWWNNNKVLNKYISFPGQLNIINSDAFATFFRAGEHLIKQGKFGKIELYQNGNWVDMYHESWHAFSQLFLTPEEQVNLYVEVINKVKKFSHLRKKDKLNDEDYLEVEEYLAEEFRAYAKNPKAKKDAPVRNSLFRRILNYLKAVFGKVLDNFRNTEMTNDVMEVEMVKKMFENLYLSSEDPSKLNQYLKNVSPDNIRFDSLNRGIKQVGDKKSDALNRQDSNLVSQTLDSIFSKFIDDVVAEAKVENQGKNSTNKKNKSAILEIFSNPENRDIAYQLAKQEIEEKLNAFRSQLGSIGTVDFNTFKDVSDLRQNAVATIMSRKGDNKYIFLRSQIDDFSSLNLDTKEGLREKGKIYYGIKIVGDYYSHKTIKDKTKDFADIIVVDDLNQARQQYDNYLNRIGGIENVNIDGFEINNEVFGGIRTELTLEQEELLDKIRILQSTLNHWGDTNKGVVKYHLENTTFDINKQVYKDVEGVEQMVNAKEDSDDFESEELEDSKGDPEKQVQETHYGAPEGIKSLNQLADPEVLYVIKSLFNVKDGEYTYNRLGFRELANFKQSWNSIARTLENIKDPQEMYVALKEASLKYPELKQLVDSKLPNPVEENSESEYNITTSFFRAFNKHRVRYLQLYAVREGNSFITEVINSSIDVSNVKRVFQAKFKAETESPYVYREKNITKLRLDKVVKDFSNPKGNLSVNKAFEFLNAIGFYYDPRLADKNSLLRLEIEKDPIKFERYGLPWIFGAIKKIDQLSRNPKASKEQLDFIDSFIQDPIQVLSDGIPPKMVPGLAQGTIQKTAVERLMLLIKLKSFQIFGLIIHLQRIQ
jgi:VCBS repeat-containing protein